MLVIPPKRRLSILMFSACMPAVIWGVWEMLVHPMEVIRVFDPIHGLRIKLTGFWFGVFMLAVGAVPFGLMISVLNPKRRVCFSEHGILFPSGRLIEWHRINSVSGLMSGPNATLLLHVGNLLPVALGGIWVGVDFEQFEKLLYEYLDNPARRAELAGPRVEWKNFMERRSEVQSRT